MEKRLISAFIDNFIATIISGLLFAVFIVSYSNNFQHFDLIVIKSRDGFKLFYMTSIISQITIIFKDTVNGRSIGKMMNGLEVVSKNQNKPITYLQLLLRNITFLILPIDIIYYFIKKERIGDIIANTKVVEVRESAPKLELKDYFLSFIIPLTLSFCLIYLLNQVFDTKAEDEHSIVLYQKIVENKELAQNITGAFYKDIDSCQVRTSKIKFKGGNEYVSILVYLSEYSNKLDKYQHNDFYERAKSVINANLEKNEQYFIGIKFKKSYNNGGYEIKSHYFNYPEIEQ